MQAIITKYLGATEKRGARVKATCQSGSVVVDWGWALSVENNHWEAAEVLLDKMGWDKAKIMGMGALPGGEGYAFVLSDKDK